MEYHSAVGQGLGPPGNHRYLQNLLLVVGSVDLHSSIDESERSLAGGSEVSPNHYRFREKCPRTNSAFARVPGSRRQQLTVVLAVPGDLHGENLLVCEQHVLNAAHLEMPQGFLRFLQPVFPGHALERLTMQQTVQTKFQFNIHVFLGTGLADVQLRSLFVETDAVVSQNPLLDNLMNPSDVDRPGTAPSVLRISVSELFELLNYSRFWVSFGDV